MRMTADVDGNVFTNATLDAALSNSPLVASSGGNFLFSASSTTSEVVLLALNNTATSVIGPGENILVANIFVASPTNLASACIEGAVVSDPSGVALGFKVRDLLLLLNSSPILVLQFSEHIHVRKTWNKRSMMSAF